MSCCLQALAAALPIRQVSRYKRENLGIEYKLEKTEPPSTEAIDETVTVFRAAGLKAY